MNNDKRNELVTRDTIIELLSDNEIGSVSTAETALRLAEGEEYLDLEHLDQGVRKAHGTSATMGEVLPRKAVQEATWTKILKKLPAHKTNGAHA